MIIVHLLALTIALNIFIAAFYIRRAGALTSDLTQD